MKASSKKSHVNISIVGASGYTGAELVTWLLRHPRVNLAHLAVRRDPLPRFSELFPQFAKKVDQLCSPMDAKKIMADSDVVFFALPHKTTMEVMPEYLALAGGKKLLIDLSGDYRLKEAAVYAKYYGAEHRDAGHLGQFTYGLSEVYGKAIAKARAIANPGCFPTGAQLALYPLCKLMAKDVASIIIDAKTGVSGGGKTPQDAFHFPECHESLKAYKIGVHQHEPEIEQGLSDVAKSSIDVVFVPHLVPMNRGIFSTIYVTLKKTWSLEKADKLYREIYADAPFVRIGPMGVSPQIKDVCHTNYCDISLSRAGETLVICSAIDNLVKGASGQAIQNMNIALGFPETEGLI